MGVRTHRGAGTRPGAAPALAVLLAAAASLPGCVIFGDPPPRLVEVNAAWVPLHGSGEHLRIVLTNTGEYYVMVGPVGEELNVTGPTGPLPIFWGSAVPSDPLPPGARMEVVFHPRLLADGRLGLSSPHEWGKPTPAVKGQYSVCLAGWCDEVFA